jgi:serine/threonine protein phosphatase PrpC
MCFPTTDIYDSENQKNEKKEVNFNNRFYSEEFTSNKGKREINEDSLQFQSGKFYLVCDGVGGSGNGQIASQLVAETVKEALLNSKSISGAVEDAERKLSSYKKKNPSTEYMATTIAVAEILDNGILVSWAGDSRVYQFRDGKTLFTSSDHSWVANAVKEGTLSSVEALFHSRANELTKSIKDSSNPVKLEQVLIKDIQPDDFFLICTDGITETWIDLDLEELFLNTKNANKIIQILRDQCEIFSEDNYSAIVIQNKPYI